MTQTGYEVQEIPLAKFSVIGAGAVGGFFGAKLATAGHDVTFVFRSDTELIRERGFTIKSAQGDFTIDNPQVVADAAELEPADFVVVAVKATANEAVIPVIKQTLKPGGAVLLIQNGINAESDYAAALDPDQSVIGAIALIAAERTEPNVVQHYSLGALTIGKYGPDYEAQPDDEQTKDLAAILDGAGVPAHVANSLLSARWQKLFWNGSFNPVSVLASMNSKEMTDEPHAADLCKRLMAEYLAAAKADGCHDLTETDCEFMFQSSVHMDHYDPSMKVDFDHGRQMEVDSIVGEPLKRGEATGTPMPSTQVVFELMSALNSKIS